MKTKAKTTLIFAVTLSLLMVACGPAAEKPIVEKPVIEDEVVEDEPKKANVDTFVNEFAYKTSEHLLIDGNANYSPMSLYLALSIANAGANGETRDELSGLLGLPQNIIEEVIEELLKESQMDEEDSKLWLANSLWVEQELDGKKVQFDKDFLSLAEGKFNAKVFPVDFGNKKTGKHMGKWIADNTNGVLEPEMVTEKGQMAAIINTLYFKDRWNSEFEEAATAKREFTSIDGKKSKIDFMNQTSNSEYAKHKEFTKANLGFQGGGKMFFVLPEENISIETLLKQDKLREIMELNGEDKQVEWSVPKFKIDSKFELIPVLKKLGVNKAFEDQADFSNMIKDTDILISEITQGTHITVEEGGVEAAAYTAIMMDKSSINIDEPVTMIMDKPFIYGITDEKGQLLFIGTYVK